MAADLLNCTCWEEWHRCYKDASPSLNTLRRAFTALLRWAYSDPNKMADYGEALACYAYNPDPDANNIISINPGSTVDPGDTENIPGILVSFDDGITFQQAGMQPYLNESKDTSTTELANLASTTLTVLCRDKDADVCCMMADLCALFLFALTERLFDTWHWLRIYNLAGQTEPKITKGSGEDDTQWYESKLTIKIEYEYRAFIARESKRLKDFSLDSTSKAPLPWIR